MAWTRAVSFSPQSQTFQGFTEVTVGPYSTPPFSTTKSFTNTYTVRISIVNRMGNLFPSSVSQVRGGFWFNHAGPTTGQSPNILSVQIVGGTYMHFRWNQGAAELEVYNNTTKVSNISIPAAITPTDTWMHIGYYYYGDSTNGRFILYVNGVSVHAYTGNTGTGAIGVFMPGPSATNQGWNNSYLDDWYADTGSGNSEGSPPSARFLYALPNAAGDDAQWSVFPSGANYLAVDDPTFDTDTTYVYAGSADLQDLYNFANITLPSGYGIVAVRVCAFAKKSNAAVDTELKLAISDGSTDVVSAGIDLTTGYTLITNSFTTDPTGNPWSQTSVNAAQFGIKSAGTF